VLRLIQGHVKINFWNNRNNRKVKIAKETLEESVNDMKTGLIRTMTKAEEFEWLEKKVLETVKFIFNEFSS
jgi:hypothetical protein